MKVAIIGSRKVTIQSIENYLPEGISEIISGGAMGIDSLAERYADEHRLTKYIIRPEYNKYPKKAAPIIRNKRIVEEADRVIAFWDGKSKGTKSTIEYAQKIGKPIQLIMINP